MKILLCETSQGSLNKNIGTEIAPKKIIEELNNYTFNEDHKKITFQTEKTTISQNISETHRNIFNKILEEEPEIILGGDHSITYSSVKAFSKRFLNPSLIILDAHPDLETSDLKEPTHEDYLRRLIEKNIISIKNIILIGTRIYSENEIKFLKEQKILYFDMKKILDLGIKETTDFITEKAFQLKNIYLSIDIDVLDPAFAPGTGYIEPGGLTTRELIYLLQRINKLHPKMIDLVEVNPEKDINNTTIKVAAKIISELAS